MSASLLGLAPETRLAIYRLLLDFDVPLVRGTKAPRYSCFAVNYNDLDEESRTFYEIGPCADTAILLTNKLTHCEAIDGFYAQNTVLIEPTDFLSSEHLDKRDISCDRSLARRVIVRCYHGLQLPARCLGDGQCLDPKRFLKQLPASPRLECITVSIADERRHLPADLFQDAMEQLSEAYHFCFTDVGRFECVAPELPKVIVEYEGFSEAWQHATSLDGPDLPFYEDISPEDDSALRMAARDTLIEAKLIEQAVDLGDSSFLRVSTFWEHFPKFRAHDALSLLVLSEKMCMNARHMKCGVSEGCFIVDPRKGEVWATTR